MCKHPRKRRKKYNEHVTNEGDKKKPGNCNTQDQAKESEDEPEGRYNLSYGSEFFMFLECSTSSLSVAEILLYQFFYTSSGKVFYTNVFV